MQTVKISSIKELLEYYHVTQREVADGLGISLRTLQNRLDAPDTFTTIELEQMLLLLNEADSQEKCTLAAIRDIIDYGKN